MLKEEPVLHVGTWPKYSAPIHIQYIEIPLLKRLSIESVAAGECKCVLGASAVNSTRINCPTRSPDYQRRRENKNLTICCYNLVLFYANGEIMVNNFY